MKSSKGQGLSMNVIIIAAIALVVLAVLVILVINSTNQIAKGSSCLSKNGYCVNNQYAYQGKIAGNNLEACQNYGKDKKITGIATPSIDNCNKEFDICCRYVG